MFCTRVSSMMTNILTTIKKKNQTGLTNYTCVVVVVARMMVVGVLFFLFPSVIMIIILLVILFVRGDFYGDK